jgi:hypothetical protein
MGHRRKLARPCGPISVIFVPHHGSCPHAAPQRTHLTGCRRGMAAGPHLPRVAPQPDSAPRAPVSAPPPHRPAPARRVPREAPGTPSAMRTPARGILPQCEIDAAAPGAWAARLTERRNGPTAPGKAQVSAVTAVAGRGSWQGRAGVVVARGEETPWRLHLLDAPSDRCDAPGHVRDDRDDSATPPLCRAPRAGGLYRPLYRVGPHPLSPRSSRPVSFGPSVPPVLPCHAQAR